MKAIILAGGFATRLWPITEKRPKPLMYLNGQPIISRIVEQIPAEMEIIVSTNQVFRNEFNRWREKFPERRIKILVEDSDSDQAKKGALAATSFLIIQENIEEEIILLAGDNYFPFALPEFISRYKDYPLLAIFDVQDLAEAKKYGVVSVQSGRVVSFIEKPAAPTSTLVSTGCYIIPKRNLADIVEYAAEHNDNLGGIFEYLLKKGERIDAFTFTETWYDIGSFNSYLQAHKNVHGDKKIIEREAVVSADSHLKGAVFIGGKSIIENSQIEDSIIMPGSVIQNCVIRDCIIDSGARLSHVDLNYKMIRAGILISG